MAAKRFGLVGHVKSGEENMMNDYLLKPQLDSIFAEVESNLPNIDFEVSDVRQSILRYLPHVLNELTLRVHTVSCS